MSDPYNCEVYADPQSLRILDDFNRRTKARSFASNQRRREIETETANTPLNNEGLEALTAALGWLCEMERMGFRFAHLALKGADPKSPLLYDPKLRVWRELPNAKDKWGGILRKNSSFKGTLSHQTFNALMDAGRQRCEDGPEITLNPPINGVVFRNGVFDLSTGEIRNFAADDYRAFLGSVDFDKDAKGRPTLVEELIDAMSGGDDRKAKLIRAVSYLNICGVHSLPAFKSAFFIWSCETGNGGRSSLFRIVGKAAGGDAAVVVSDLSSLNDPNTLLRLNGRNYVYVDECNLQSSAKSKSVAVLKNITGGLTKLEVWKKFQDKHEIEGHWCVNQALNSTEFLYGADKALLLRSVPLVTPTLPVAMREEFAKDAERSKALFSDAECSRFLRALWVEFGDPQNAALFIDEAKGAYSDDLASLVTEQDPLSEFCEECLLPQSGKETPIEMALDAYNKWLRINYPNNSVVNKVVFGRGLKKMGIKCERIRDGETRLSYLIGYSVLPIYRQ